MKALVQDRYGPPDVLRFSDIAKPEPGNDDVLVKVRAAGVDPGVWHVTAGMPYLIRLMGFGFRAPKVRVRADLAGEVEAVGTNVTRFKPGDEVFGTLDGGFAEYACGNASRLTSKPASLTFDEAAVVTTSGTAALQAVRDYGEIEQGQSVLVIGAAGGIGSYSVQLAKALGAQTVTAVCSGGKADLVRGIGADDVIDYTREDFTDSGRTWDLIIDTAGLRSLARIRKALTPRGTLVIVGGEGGDWLLGGLLRSFAAKFLSRFSGQRLRAPFIHERAEDLEYLREAVENGKLKPVIDRTFSLDDTPEAIRYLHQGHASGKVVVTV
ncbi:NAD(P)-dependent alcohol dehydrogenase [Flindersiella endophytica]